MNVEPIFNHDQTVMEYGSCGYKFKRGISSPCNTCAMFQYGIGGWCHEKFKCNAVCRDDNRIGIWERLYTCVPMWDVKKVVIIQDEYEASIARQILGG